MSRTSTILCGEGRTRSSGQAGHAVALSLSGSHSNIALRIGDISDRMVANIPDRLVDVVEIASYVFCADQAIPRGGGGIHDHGAGWRRDFDFHIPVRDLRFWKFPEVVERLARTLGLMSEDHFEFQFTKIKSPPPLSHYLDFGTGGGTGFRADEVMLFSGGLDSLAGAIEEALCKKRKTVLVTHKSAPKIMSLQDDLAGRVHKLSKGRTLYVPVRLNKESRLSREFTQRTRALVYATLGVVVARVFGRSRIRMYENGVVSMNLPVCEQLVGARASRTTHPEVLHNLGKFFSLVVDEEFAVENPFLMQTRTDVVRGLRATEGRKLIRYTTSCSHPMKATTEKSHCGACYQCIDRRFATLGAGCTKQEDPAEQYGVDLLTGARGSDEDRALADGYVRFARSIQAMSLSDFAGRYGEVFRIAGAIPAKSTDEAVARIHELYRRHATQVLDVLERRGAGHMKDLLRGDLPPTCILAMALPDTYKKRSEAGEGVGVHSMMSLGAATNRERRGSCVAVLEASGRFGRFRRAVGKRQLFFLLLLFRSEREMYEGGSFITYVTQQEAASELLSWKEAGTLEFTGRDVDTPEWRVQKMWREFKLQLDKDPEIGRLFVRANPSDLGKQWIYGVRARPAELQVLLPDVAAAVGGTR